MTAEPARPGLPPPDGVVGHLRYSFAALRLMAAWRRRYRQLDTELRAAVRHRDDALARVGDAALAGTAAGGPDPVSRFADTLSSLAGEQVDATARVDDLRVELAAQEDAQRERLAAIDQEIADLRARMAPLEEDLAARRRRLGELERRAADQAEQVRNLEARRQHLEARQEAPDPATTGERARQQEELRTLGERLEALATETAARQADITAQREPVEVLREQVAAHEEQLREVRRKRVAAQQETDAALAEVRTRIADGEQQVAGLADRRRAVLMDLGREVLRLQHEGVPDDVRGEALEALSAIQRLREERAALDEERARFDGGPLRRTTLALLGVVVLLVILLTRR